MEDDESRVSLQHRNQRAEQDELHAGRDAPRLVLGRMGEILPLCHVATQGGHSGVRTPRYRGLRGERVDLLQRLSADAGGELVCDIGLVACALHVAET